MYGSLVMAIQAQQLHPIKSTVAMEPMHLDLWLPVALVAVIVKPPRFLYTRKRL